MSNMKWRRVQSGAGITGAGNSGDLEARERIELGLGRRGIPLERCESLAREIEPRLRELDAEDAERVLDGVALGLVDCLPSLPVLPVGTGAQRVEARLFRDFSREVQKLEETVKVLNAYLQRLSEPRAPGKIRRLQ